jgi:chromosome segregation protein
VHLRSITMKGFKSFPTRTKLEFAPGVAVIVGPNGSGKSNITDAVLWALGEQSPLAVRGQSMKDVIFAGGHGVKGVGSAEVEVVIDNADGRLDTDFSEISIVRRLGRDGEGEYRLNGARCRLVDVLEVLSDSGLGKEMHSVVSQGKVEQIVLSRPRERRLLIEEAAGLGKHRKRRRRAQLKLERTEENLSRALDVEREARSRLRPLKRQAEAAELHERIERQSLEARLELARDDARAARAALVAAEEQARAARAARDEGEKLLAAVAQRREQAEEEFARHSREREQLQGRLFAARSASDRIAMRLERAREQAATADERRERRLRQLEVLEAQAAADIESDRDPLPEERLPRPPAEHEDRTEWEALAAGDRIRAIELELARLEREREQRLAQELTGLEAERDAAAQRRAELGQVADARLEELKTAERVADAARAERRDAERAVEATRRRTAEVGAELATVNQFLRSAGGAPGGGRTLAQAVDVEPGYELALAAALGPRLSAAMVDDVASGEALLDEAGDAGGSALVARADAAHSARGEGSSAAPTSGAESLLGRVRADGPLAAVVARLLQGVWVVDSLTAVPDDFAGVAVTRSGRLLDGATGELAQAPAGGAERLLEERARRERLVVASQAAAAAEADAVAALQRLAEAVMGADAARDAADGALRAARRDAEDATEVAARAERSIVRRREAPDEGPDAIRRAELLADMRAERRMAERIGREREERAQAIAGLQMGIERDAGVARDAAGAAEALESAHAAVTGRRETLASDLAAGAAAGEQTAAALRACAQEEAQLQTRLRAASEAVTGAEVAAQQARDGAADVERELTEVAGRLGLEPEPATEALPAQQRAELAQRLERLQRRREQLGPVNPLAKQEYEEAVAHVEELETQRGDLEAALAELQGLIKETDKRIRESFEETFAAAAKNFEDVVAHLFPGGRGHLRLVHPEQTPRAVIGGEAPADAPEDDPPPAEEADADEVQAEAGVEIEVTPPGKSTKRLSLLSGGEKSLVALAFMFAVFLARPCPFYILDEVEAALDDLNIDRFLQLVNRYSDRAQFIVVTHQKRTMDAADTLYGVSMGGDGVSRVVSRKLAGKPAAAEAIDEGARPAA